MIDPETLESLVSIVVPCFEQAHYLGLAITSALAQHYRPLEVMVIDDGSRDDVRGVTSAFPEVRYLRQANGGVAAARNTGLRHTDGEYVVFLDADDVLREHAVGTGVRELEAHPEAAFTFGRVHDIDATGRPLATWDAPRPDDDDIYRSLLVTNFIFVPAVMYRRSALEATGGFDERLRYGEDYDLLLRLARQFPAHRHDAVVADYRRHEGSGSKRVAAMLAATQRVLRRQRPHIRNDPTLLTAWREGRRSLRAYWGNRVVESMRRDARRGRWRRLARSAAILARHAPRTLLTHGARRGRQVLRRLG